MRIELTIQTDYLPQWGAYEGVRELVQNGHDARAELGATFTVRHRAPDTLIIENEGATLPHEALLFGHTSKAGRAECIGKFGEGLKLGMLALVRAGHAIKIRSGSEVWQPRIEHSERFNADVLAVHIVDGREAKDRVQVEIGGLTREAWNEMKANFLFLAPSSLDRVATKRGTLLLGDEHNGRLYVKGIFVQHGSTHFGYDLSHADVDRDRRMVGRYDVEYETQYIWAEALATRPDLIGSFADLLDNDSDDVRAMATYSTAGDLPDDVRAELVAAFLKRFGSEAVPVANLAESRDLEHYGKRGIIVPKAKQRVLETKLGSLESVKEALRKQVARFVSWGELSPDMRAHLDRAVAIVARVAGERFNAAAVDVCEFKDATMGGLYSEGRVQLAARVLASRAETLRVLVHETAHLLGGGDGDKGHVDNVEKLWSAIADSVDA